MPQPLLLALLWAGCLAQYTVYRLDVPKMVTVQEGLCVFVPCRILQPSLDTRTSSVLGHWFQAGANTNSDPPVATSNPDQPVQEETKNRFHLLGDPKGNNCSLDIRDARRADSGSYFFGVDGSYVKYNYLYDQLSVRVIALTQTPDILIPGTLESGHPINISCAVPWACRRGTPPIFSWIGATLTSPLGPKTPHSSVLTLMPLPHHHGTNLTCRVTFPGADVTVERTVQLAVSYAPQNLSIRVFQDNSTVPEVLDNATSLRVQEGQSLRLVCDADSNPPARMSWTQGGLTLNPSQSLDSRVLELPQVLARDGGEFTCWAQHPLGSSNVSLSLDVQGTSCSCPQIPGEQQYSWPLVLTLFRGALMGTGFLLTYDLTWIYYTRIGGSQVDRATRSS